MICSKTHQGREIARDSEDKMHSYVIIPPSVPCVPKASLWLIVRFCAYGTAAERSEWNGLFLFVCWAVALEIISLASHLFYLNAHNKWQTQRRTEWTYHAASEAHSKTRKHERDVLAHARWQTETKGFLHTKNGDRRDSYFIRLQMRIICVHLSPGSVAAMVFSYAPQSHLSYHRCCCAVPCAYELPFCVVECVGPFVLQYIYFETRQALNVTFNLTHHYSVAWTRKCG